MTTTDPETGPVDRSTFVKGYQFEKDQHVLLTNEEIASVKLASTKTLDIERFVSEADIDPI